MAFSIAINGMFRHDQLAGGVYSYLENLLRGLIALQDEPGLAGRFDLTVFHGRAGLRWHDERITFRGISDRLGRFAAESRIGAWDAAGMDAVLFPNYFTPPLVRARRAVGVIHDLQFLHIPDYYKAINLAWLKMCHAWTLRACNAVVAISSVVKEDLVAQYGSRWADRIHVIWNPVCMDRFEESEPSQITGGRPYIMCVAMDRPQKNLFTLIRAFDRVKDKFPDYCLVMAGQLRSARKVRYHKSRHFSEQMPPTIDLVRDLKLEERVFVTGFVSDTVLGSLYRGASLFVLPSIFEGFGMPAVESIAMGTPTLVSGLPVLREVTMNQAHYIDDPRCDSEMAEHIESILANIDAARPSPELQSEIRRRFAPATIARQYLTLLTNGSIGSTTGP